MKMKVPILALLLATIVPARSEVTVISGISEGGKGQIIRLMTYTDQVTYLRKTLASAMIGENDSFLLQTELDETIYAWIDIGFRQGDLYLQPGQKYEIRINPGQQAISDSYYNRSALPVEILKDDDDRLNHYIRDFNQLYNDFLLNYAENIRDRGSASSYNAFTTAIDLRFKNATNPYFKDYLKYKTASMQLFLRLKSRDKIGLEFLSGQQVKYQNIEYMDFFHLFFEKYFFSGNKYFNYNKTYDMVNYKAPLAAIMDSLGKDPVVTGAELKELLLLSGLKELYQVSGFDRERIMELILEIAETGSESQSRQIASNLAFRLTRLKPGSPAPDFSLPSITDQKKYTLADFRGKSLYLAFFDSGNPASQAELSLVGDIYDEFSDKVSFVAIAVDRDPGKILEDKPLTDLPWKMLYFDNNLDLLESYDAVAFPAFILINEEGRIVSCPAPSPSENVRKSLIAF